MPGCAAPADPGWSPRLHKTDMVGVMRERERAAARGGRPSWGEAMEEGREVLTLSLAPAPHGVDFMVEVARVRPPRPPRHGAAPRRSPSRRRPRASEQRATARLEEPTAWSPPVRRGGREREDESREEGADVWSI